MGVKESPNGSGEDLLRNTHDISSSGRPVWGRDGSSLPGTLGHSAGLWLMSIIVKVCLVKAMVFPGVMYRCESWTIMKAEYRRIDAFEFWCWRRLLSVPWTARRSNQSILREISPKYSFEGLMLKLKLQYFGHLMQRVYLLKKTLMLGKTECKTRRGGRR